MTTIAHLTGAAEWAAACAAGEYRLSTRGRTLDEEGFIHCSRPDQVERTANAYYRGVDDLLVLLIDRGRVVAPVRDEHPPGSEELYPHIYGPLNLDAVVATSALHPGPDGTFEVQLPLTA